MTKDPDCAVCAVIDRHKLPEDSRELFHQYVDKLGEMSDILDEAQAAGYDFEEGVFDAALDELSSDEEAVPPKSKMN